MKIETGFDLAMLLIPTTCQIYGRDITSGLLLIWTACFQNVTGCFFDTANVLNSSYTKWDKCCCSRDADLHGWCTHCDGGVTDVDNSPIKWESCHFSSVSYLYSGHTLSSNFY